MKRWLYLTELNFLEVRQVHQENVDSNIFKLHVTGLGTKPRSFPIELEAHVPPVKLEFPSKILLAVRQDEGPPPEETPAPDNSDTPEFWSAW